LAEGEHEYTPYICIHVIVNMSFPECQSSFISRRISPDRVFVPPEEYTHCALDVDVNLIDQSTTPSPTVGSWTLAPTFGLGLHPTSHHHECSARWSPATAAPAVPLRLRNGEPSRYPIVSMLQRMLPSWSLAMTVPLKIVAPSLEYLVLTSAAIKMKCVISISSLDPHN
jgi:hypothetical protein